MSQEIQDGLESTDSQIESNNTPVETQETNETSNLNPAWNEFLETIPTEYVSKATPILQDWDRNFQEVQSANAKFKPYEEFISHDPSALREALQIAELLNNDPRGVFDRIGEHHGYLDMNAGQGDDEEEYDYDPDSGEEEEEGYDLSDHPEFQQMQEQNQAFQNYVEQQEAAKQEAAANEFIENEINEIKKLNGGDIDADALQMISDMALGAMNSTGKLDLISAYNQYSKFVSTARNTSANNSIPSVVSGMGNSPVTPKSYKSDSFESTMEEKLKALGFGN